MTTEQLSQQSGTAQRLLSVWLLGAITFSAVKVFLGMVGFLGGLNLELLSPTPFSEEIFVLNMLVFAGSAAALIFGGYRDRRAVYLAAVFLAIASSFADRPLRGSALFFRHWFHLPLDLLVLPDTSAFLPAFLWLFVREFPRGIGPGFTSRMFRVGLSISLVAGVVLFGANVLLLFDRLRSVPTLWAVLNSLKIGKEHTYYWMIVFWLVLPTLPLAIWKARNVA